MSHAETVDEVFWTDRPAQSPASYAECLTSTANGNCSVPHAWQCCCNTTKLITHYMNDLSTWTEFNITYNRSHQTHTSYRGRVLRVKWPNQQHRSTEGR